MRLARLLRHALATHWRTRMLFPRATLDAIEKAIREAERTHAGQIRFAIETALTPMHIWHRVSAHKRALEVFSALRVWDTERNNGVLVYLLLADRSVEIVADRGFKSRVSAAEWAAVCRLIESHFLHSRFKSGCLAGIEAIGALIARHFPGEIPVDSTSAVGVAADNELSDRPTLL